VAYKVYDGPVLVDVIFRLAGGAIDDDHFCALRLEVAAQSPLVASIDDVMVTKPSPSEQEPDFWPCSGRAALREQIDGRGSRAVEFRHRGVLHARRGLGIVDDRACRRRP
jgi:hypothetical protein